MNTQDTTYALEAGAEGFFASDIEIEEVKNTTRFASNGAAVDRVRTLQRCFPGLRQPWRR